MVKDEFGLITYLRSRLASMRRTDTVVGIGDDAAVLDMGLEKDYLLWATDSIVEGKHFNFNIEARALIGRKAVGTAMSDIAAMGGYPVHITVDIGLPPYVEMEDVNELLKGMEFLADLFSVDIVGGDTVASDRLYISVGCLGRVEKEWLTLRSGARKLDEIWVSGPLGGSIYGRHLKVSPRVPEARFLVQNFKPTAMIDISDGLVADLYHILEESQVVAEIVRDWIPLHKDARSFDEALYMGEDFELLFCLSEDDSRRLEAMGNKLEYRFYHIGKVLEAGSIGLYMRDGEAVYPLERRGFSHF